jgi:DNA mismatch endonuclease (patch repair protein)
MKLFTPSISVDSPKGKRGQAYNLNLAGSGILAPDGRGNWHISPKCDTSPKTNRDFLVRKRETNMARDRHVTRQLRGRGWKVIRIWQHSLKKSPCVCLTRIRCLGKPLGRRLSEFAICPETGPTDRLC